MGENNNQDNEERNLDVYGTLEITVSMTVKAKNENEAKEMAEFIVNDDYAEIKKLLVASLDGKKIDLEMHGFSYTAESVFEEWE